MEESVRQREKDKEDITPSPPPSGSNTLERTTTTLSKADYELERLNTVRTIGLLKLRGKSDDLPQSWWFASTAIPLIAATIGPLANVLSIAALASQWRDVLPNNGQLPEGADANGIGIRDPEWEYVLNAISLAFGYVGNLFLLLNFTKRVRYIVALPASIICWFASTALLTSSIIGIHVYAAPVAPGETYSQGFWHAVMAAVLYFLGSFILMINMLGYFLGHYPQHFELDDDQRTLILQTMMFFFWLAGGAAVFQRVCGWDYADALYFCDVTVLTVGFGDFVGVNDTGRGLVFPYSVFGIIFLGLMINSIRKFASSMSKDKVIKAHTMHERERTVGRTVTNEKELRDKLGLPPRRDSSSGKPANGRRLSAFSRPRQERLRSLEEFGHFEMRGRTITFHEKKNQDTSGRGGAGNRHSKPTNSTWEQREEAQKEKEKVLSTRAKRRQKLLLLREEKDRFDAMRAIQQNTSKFRGYYSLAMSVLAFSLLWCLGAVVFMLAEEREQDLSYFEALYFCYVSLLTIGYGDFSPKSNVGKPFFVVWSLIAIPTMTILISDMGDTVISAVNRGTFTLADWTIMPKKGAWKDFLDSHPRLKEYIEIKLAERKGKARLKRGFEIRDPDLETGDDKMAEGDGDPSRSVSDPTGPPTLEQLAKEGVTEHDLARKLAKAIKRVAHDLKDAANKKYSYEDWVEFTRLIRFSARNREEVAEEEEEEGLIEWDWIGEDSPMLADETEPQWILDRLCESLNRYTRLQANHRKNHLKDAAVLRRRGLSSSIRADSLQGNEEIHFPLQNGDESPDPQEIDELAKDMTDEPNDEDRKEVFGNNSSARLIPETGLEHPHEGMEFASHGRSFGPRPGGVGDIVRGVEKKFMGHEGDEKPEGYMAERGGGEDKRGNTLQKLHWQTESEAVREWEARVKANRSGHNVHEHDSHKAHAG